MKESSTYIESKVTDAKVIISAEDILDAISLYQDSIVIFDLKWRYLYLNRKGWDVLNQPAKSVLGKNVWELLPHIKNTAFETAAKQAMRTKKVIEIEEYYPHRQMWAKTTFYPTRNILMVRIQDITELVNEKQVNDQLIGDLHGAMKIYLRERNHRLRTEREPSNSE